MQPGYGAQVIGRRTPNGGHYRYKLRLLGEGKGLQPQQSNTSGSQTRPLYCKCCMIPTIGRRSASTMSPTTKAMNTIMTGSMMAVSATTAWSTSSS